MRSRIAFRWKRMRQASTPQDAAITTKKPRMPSRMADGHRVGGSAKRRLATTRNTPHSAASVKAKAARIVLARIRTCWRVPCSSPGTLSNRGRTNAEPSPIFSYTY